MAEQDPTTLPPDEPEVWRPIPGFARYEASTLGRIRWIETRSGFLESKRVLKQSESSEYPMVSLFSDVKGQTRKRVHTLVLLAFCGPCPPGYECRHLDDQKMNRRLSNLKWGTRSENLGDDRRRNGILTVGSKHGMSKLTEPQAAEIWVVALLRVGGQRERGTALPFGPEREPRSLDPEIAPGTG